VSEADFAIQDDPFARGDVSFHYGWTMHRAGANQTAEERSVMTMIYMDAAMRLKQPENQAQENDWRSWCPGVEVGAVCDSPINPVIPSR